MKQRFKHHMKPPRDRTTLYQKHRTPLRALWVNAPLVAPTTSYSRVYSPISPSSLDTFMTDSIAKLIYTNTDKNCLNCHLYVHVLNSPLHLSSESQQGRPFSRGCGYCQKCIPSLEPSFYLGHSAGNLFCPVPQSVECEAADLVRIRLGKLLIVVVWLETIDTCIFILAGCVYFTVLFCWRIQ